MHSSSRGVKKPIEKATLRRRVRVNHRRKTSIAAIFLTALSLISWPSAQCWRAEASEATRFNPFESQLYSLDPCQVEFRRLLKAISARPETDFTLEGYHYESTPGIVMHDSGFIPSYQVMKPTPRKVIFNKNKFEVDRLVSTEEINLIRSLARQTVIESYGSKIQPEIIKAVDQIEDRLGHSKLNFGVVKDHSEKIVGVVRIVEAEASGGRVILPGFEIMRLRNLLDHQDELKISNLFKYQSEHGIEKLGMRGLEIGQFYIDKNLPAESRELVRKNLLQWIRLRNYSSAVSPEMTMVHTSRAAHHALWSGTYGFSEEVVSKTDLKGVTEQMSQTSGDALNAVLDSILKGH